MKFNSFVQSLVVPLLLVSSHVCSTPLIDQTGNLLSNGSFEQGTTSPVTGHGAASAGANWRQWSNSGGPMVSELLDNSELITLTGGGVIDGSRALRMSTSGGGDGLFTFDYNHANWNNSFADMTFSAWVYVISGQVGAFVGSNANGFEGSLSTSTGQWEFLTYSKQGGVLNNELLLYSSGGPAEFIVDSVWLNYGLESLHPGRIVMSASEPGSLILLGIALFCLYKLRNRKSLQTKETV